MCPRKICGDQTPPEIARGKIEKPGDTPASTARADPSVFYGSMAEFVGLVQVE